MATRHNPTNQIENRIQQMEASERRRSRRRWVMLLASAILLTVGTASMVRPTHREGVGLRLVAADTLSVMRVEALFQESAAPLVIHHPMMDTTVLAKVADYEQYVDQLTQALAALSPTEPIPPSASVTINGDKQVGVPLTFEIAPFDTAYQLALDFGNGMRRSVTSPVTQYAYPLPGHFDMLLLWEQADSAQVLQILQYEIRRAAVAEEPDALTPGISRSSPN